MFLVVAASGLGTKQSTGILDQIVAGMMDHSASSAKNTGTETTTRFVSTTQSTSSCALYKWLAKPANPYTDQFEPKCPLPGMVISTVEECEEAGQAVGGWLPNGGASVGDWKNSPCGCYLNSDGHISWNTKEGNCRNDGDRFQPVCRTRGFELGMIVLRINFSRVTKI